MLISGDTDALNAIVTVHPGAGGNESRRTGQRCSCVCISAGQKRHGCKAEMNDYQDGEEAGIKSATFTDHR